MMAERSRVGAVHQIGPEYPCRTNAGSTRAVTIMNGAGRSSAFSRREVVQAADVGGEVERRITPANFTGVAHRLAIEADIET